MLLGPFFTLLEKQTMENNSYRVVVAINPRHPIFEGHFPGNPIVPGVCLTQMVKEILENILGKSFTMSKADSIKFTAIVNPEINSELETKLALKFLENETVQAELSFFNGDTVFYKFKGCFISTT